MPPILYFSHFEIQCKHLEKFRSKKNRRLKLNVFYMYGTVALLSPIPVLLLHKYQTKLTKRERVSKRLYTYKKRYLTQSGSNN